MEKPPIEFTEKAIRIAGAEYSASITAGGFEWISNIFNDYEADESESDADKWLRVRFKEEFRCIGSRPSWICEGPIWPFISGQPMVFIGQLSGEGCHDTRCDAEYFLFAGTEETEAGPRRVTKVITQYRSSGMLGVTAESLHADEL